MKNKNSYYLITLPLSKDRKRSNDFLQKGKSIGNARDIPHARYSNDGSKVIVQGEITDQLKTYVDSDKTNILYLGDCLENGQAEQKVHDYINDHPEDWGSNEEK